MDKMGTWPNKFQVPVASASAVASLLVVIFSFIPSTSSLYAADVEKLHVTTKIRCRYAVTVVRSRIYNPDDASREARFEAVLPETAVISNFSLVTDGKKYVGRVEERESALKEYERAKGEGQLGVVIRQHPRFTNSYKISINLEPGAQADFTLIYEELLVRRLGSYKLVINVNPGQIVEDLRVFVGIDETRPIEFVDASDIESSDLIPLPGKRKTKDSNPAIVQRPKPNQTFITYAPTVEEQERASFASGIGRFRVTYDVDHAADGGEIQVGGDYFVHFFAPTSLTPMRKFVTFVLDVSGSMTKGHKLYEVKDAMRKILRDMTPDDYFSVIAFADDVTVWETKEKENVRFAAAATSANVDSAINFVNKLRANGATNVYDALERAVKDVYEARNQGQPESKEQTTETVPDLIFFLTDGRPTTGKFIKETEVLHELSRVNYRKDVVIHSLGFGDDVNSDFLERLSLMNGGDFRRIHVAPDASLQLDQFYREVSTPLMSNLDFHYSLPGIDDSILTSTEFHLLYDGSEVVVAGKFKNEVDALSDGKSPRGEIIGRTATQKRNLKIEFPKPVSRLDIHPVRQESPIPNFIERLWAYMLVNQMIKEHKAVENEWLSRSLREEALKMALQYGFVTPLTAMIIVKPKTTSTSTSIRQHQINVTSLPDEILVLDDGTFVPPDDEVHRDDVVKTPNPDADVESDRKLRGMEAIDSKLSEKRDLEDQPLAFPAAAAVASESKLSDPLNNAGFVASSCNAMTMMFLFAVLTLWSVF